MLFPKVGRKQFRLRLAWYTVVAIILFGIVLHLFPFVFMISTSLKSGSETMRFPPTLFPREIDTSAWQLFFNVVTANSADTRVRDLLREPFWVYFRNSLIQVFGVLAISLPVTAFAAYANSKLQKGWGQRLSFLFFIGTLMVPGVVTLIPAFLLTRNFPFALPSPPLIPGTEDPFPVIRIWNTHWVIILPAVFNAFNYLLFKGYFDTIPNSIIQAARVDGGSEFNIFRRIVFPMSIPVFAVAAWLQFEATWNSLLWPMLTTQSSSTTPTSVAISGLIQRMLLAGTMSGPDSATSSRALEQLLDAGLTWNGMMVLGILQTIPVFLMFIVCREYLMRGIRIRGLK
ncbi:MAG: carbohydrate ABC transporter permease [bacterium]|nr:carbohydrate ABC transporter permease [bacterium]